MLREKCLQLASHQNFARNYIQRPSNPWGTKNIKIKLQLFVISTQKCIRMKWSTAPEHMSEQCLKLTSHKNFVINCII